MQETFLRYNDYVFKRGHKIVFEFGKYNRDKYIDDVEYYEQWYSHIPDEDYF